MSVPYYETPESKAADAAAVSVLLGGAGLGARPRRAYHGVYDRAKASGSSLVGNQPGYTRSTPNPFTRTTPDAGTDTGTDTDAGGYDDTGGYDDGIDSGVGTDFDGDGFDDWEPDPDDSGLGTESTPRLGEQGVTGGGDYTDFIQTDLTTDLENLDLKPSLQVSPDPNYDPNKPISLTNYDPEQGSLTSDDWLNEGSDSTIIGVDADSIADLYDKYGVDLTANPIERVGNWFRDGSDGGLVMDTARIVTDLGAGKAQELISGLVTQGLVKPIYDATGSVEGAIGGGLGAGAVAGYVVGKELDERIRSGFGSTREREGFLATLFGEGFTGPTTQQLLEIEGQLREDRMNGVFNEDDQGLQDYIDHALAYADLYHEGAEGLPEFQDAFEHERWVPDPDDILQKEWFGLFGDYEVIPENEGKYNDDYLVIDGDWQDSQDDPIDNGLGWVSPTDDGWPDESGGIRIQVEHAPETLNDWSPVYDQEGQTVGFETVPAPPAGIIHPDYLDDPLLPNIGDATDPANPEFWEGLTSPGDDILSDWEWETDILSAIEDDLPEGVEVEDFYDVGFYPTENTDKYRDEYYNNGGYDNDFPEPSGG